jgi:hypothetical protein
VAEHNAPPSNSPFRAGWLSLLLGGGASGALFLLGFLRILSPLPLYGAAINDGWLAALVGAAAGYALVAWFQPPMVSIGLFFGGIALAPVIAGWVAWRDGRYALDGARLGQAVAAIAATGAVVGALMVAVYDRAAGKAGASTEALKAMFAKVQEQFISADLPPDTLEALRAPYDQIAQLPIGAIEAALSNGWALVHLLAAWIMMGFARRGGVPAAQVDYRTIQTPLWAYAALGVSAAAALVAGDSRAGPMIAAAILSLPFLMEGLAVVHAVTAKRQAEGRLPAPLRVGFLTLTWLLTLTTPVLNVVITLIGMTDRWLGWRRRFA